MQQLWIRLTRSINTVNRIGVVLAEIALILLLLLVFHEVIARYLFDRPTTYSVELSEYLLIFIAFIAGGWVLREDKHVRMRSLVNLFPTRLRQGIRCLNLLLVFSFCAVLVWQGTRSAMMAFHGGYHSSSLLNVPMWLPYSVIPLGALLLALQSIVSLGETLARLFSDNIPDQ